MVGNSAHRTALHFEGVNKTFTRLLVQFPRNYKDADDGVTKAGSLSACGHLTPGTCRGVGPDAGGQAGWGMAWPGGTETDPLSSAHFLIIRWL